MEAINIAGAQILSLLMTIAYWVVLIVGTGKIINAITKKDVESAVKCAITYGVAFASIFLLRWTLDLIRDIFA